MARKKGEIPTFNCHECGTPGGIAITCGYCKLKNGIRTTHTLCDSCFVKQGCPVAHPKEIIMDNYN